MWNSLKLDELEKIEELEDDDSVFFSNHLILTSLSNSVASAFIRLGACSFGVLATDNFGILRGIPSFSTKAVWIFSGTVCFGSLTPFCVS